MHWSRREFLGWASASAVAAGANGLALASGAAELDVAALAQWMGGIRPESSARISLDLPVFAEAGARVPLSVMTDLPNVDSISLFVDRNARPWAATFRLAQPATPSVRTQLRIESSSNVVAVVRTSDPVGHFYASADVIVTTTDSCP
jgi:sulfur-oxidizing protein SoxY